VRFRAVALAAALVGTSLAAAACGGGGTTAQVVGTPVTRPHPAPTTPIRATGGSSTPTTAVSGTGTGSSVPTGGSPPSAPPVSPTTITQLNAQLGALGTSLNQVDTDLAQAQGDQ
jgi:hypothetical protein